MNMNDNDSETLRCLLGEMAAWRKGDANRQQQIDLLYATVKDLATVYGKLHGAVVALQNAVEAIGARRN
jgi:hypothetical protein